MEIDYHKAMLLLFGIGVFGAIVFMIIGSFFRHSPDRKKKLELLNDKAMSTKKELAEVYVKQIHALNSMLQNGAISPVNYDIERSKIMLELNRFGIDPQIILHIPRPAAPDIKGLFHKKLNTSTSLNELGGMNDDELNDNINEALDDMKKLK